MVVMVATEQMCGLIIALSFMLAIGGWFVWEQVRDQKPIDPLLHKAHTIYYIITMILLLCYCILLCFA